MCVAQYHCNKKWYRGLVKKINNENNVQVQGFILIFQNILPFMPTFYSYMNFNISQVEFVDYGNVEDCEIGTLKKRIILGNLPIQCTKCVIHGLYSVRVCCKNKANLLTLSKIVSSFTECTRWKMDRERIRRSPPIARGEGV